MHGERMSGESVTFDNAASSSVVARMLLYVELFRRGPSPRGGTIPSACHSLLLAMRISELRNQDVNDKLPRRFGSGEDRCGAESAGVIRYGKHELDDRLGSGPGRMGDSAPSGTDESRPGLDW